MPLVRTVDVDLAFLLEFAVDWIWLWAAGRLGGAGTAPWRLTAVAAVAAALGVLSGFAVGGPLHWWPVKVFGSLFWVVLAYAGRVPWQACLRICLFFWLAGAAMAGGGLLLAPLAPGALVPASAEVWVGYAAPPATAPWVLLGMAMTLAGGAVLWRAARQWQRVRAGLVRVAVDLPTGCVELTALVDSGNRLREPMSGAPVMVVDLAAVTAQLPPAVRAAALHPERPELLAALPPPWDQSCRPVPYQSLGRASGLLLSVLPTGLRISNPVVGGRDRDSQTRLYIGLSPAPLDPSGLFQALLPPEIPGPAPTLLVAAGAGAAGG